MKLDEDFNLMTSNYFHILPALYISSAETESFEFFLSSTNKFDSEKNYFFLFFYLLKPRKRNH